MFGKMLRILTYLCIVVTLAICYQISPISDETTKYPKPFGLYYDAQHRKLFWADYLLHQIVCYNLNDGRIYAATTSPRIDPWYIVPFENDPFLFLVNNGTTNYVVGWDTKSSAARIIRKDFAVETSSVNNTCSMAKVAPNCDIIFGTLRTTLCVDGANSATYSYNEADGIREIIQNQITSGEVGWNVDGSKFYQLDSCGGVVREYHYHSNTGHISGGRVVYSYTNGVSEDDFKPVIFGLTVDTAGNLYLASYHGGIVIIVNPKTGKQIGEIQIPGPVVASVVWGGDNLDILFVSTASVPRDFYSGINSNETLSPGSGLIYAVTNLNARGVPVRKVCSKHLTCLHR